jgi:serine/threonine protein kinase
VSKVKKNEMCFAVKELRVTRGLREAVALKRLNDKQHPHLIRLLATYTYQDRFHLIFPWADGNLKEFWEKRSPRLQGENNRLEPVAWMSKQILGLSRALKLIHYCEIDKINAQGLTADELKRLHGRHGDLKPENILWFRDEDSLQQNSIGVLKIGDFGFADFHSKHSKSNVRRSAVEGVTDTYSAPEYDVAQRVSPQFDIWSFGCILLQFVVWFLNEWGGIEEFSKIRTAESKGFLFASDNFYSLHTGGTRGYRAQVKASVSEVSGPCHAKSIVPNIVRARCLKS